MEIATWSLLRWPEPKRKWGPRLTATKSSATHWSATTTSSTTPSPTRRFSAEDCVGRIWQRVRLRSGAGRSRLPRSAVGTDSDLVVQVLVEALDGRVLVLVQPRDLGSLEHLLTEPIG